MTMTHVYETRKLSALNQFPNTDWNIKPTGNLIVNGTNYLWHNPLCEWVEDCSVTKISSETFLTFFKAKHGNTRKVTLLLNLGGLALAEVYQDKVVFRYGSPVTHFHINLAHYTLTKDVIEIMNDGGAAYRAKLDKLI